MSKIFVVFAVFLPAIFAASPFRRCQFTNHPLPDAVFFGGRENPCLQEPCPVFRSVGSGTTYIDFTAPRTITNFRPHLRARVIGITVDHDLPQSMMNNPWDYVIGPNPLNPGNQATFNLTVPVEPNTPLVTSVNIFTLFDQNGQVIFCYEIQSVVRDSP